ncbi:conserved hypothetical protein [Trichinella spiralis]|uniref:hypothetical protein n=1 Tax=Trichinella spiralis TaxID=6334 RepID=UPI0001EFC152|nr:conserved hypothetical protein [Trichinella spiralis]
MHGVTFFALASCLVFTVCTAAPLIVRIYEEGADTAEVTSVSRESIGDYQSHYENRDYQRTLKYPKLVKEFGNIYKVIFCELIFMKLLT